MNEKAIEKINAEMQKEPSNKYMEILGHYLIDRANGDDIAAHRICVEGKTLKQAMGVIEGEARKVKNGNCAVLSDNTVFDLLDKYFELPLDRAARAAAVDTESGNCTAPVPASGKLNLDFDSLI